MNPETHLLASWKGQWRLDAWPNRLLSVFLFGWALRLAVVRGYSFVGVFSGRLDRVFVSVLQNWNRELRAWWIQKRTGRRALSEGD